MEAIARLRCPRCREGKVFRSSFRISERCPVCDLQFEREPGYFVAAMYISYALAVPVVALLALAVHLAFAAWPVEAVIGAAALLSLPLAPSLFRYSRVLWMHLDRKIDRSP
jgi:uncharacterized protein (DUF983 family)